MYRARGFIFRKTAVQAVMVWCVLHTSGRTFVPYTRFHLQDWLQIVISVIYRNNECLCVCLCVCVCVLECVGVRVCVAFALYMTSPITMTMDSTSDTAAGDMFRHDETARPTPLLFRVLSFCFVFFFCPSCTILRQPRPAAPSQWHRNCFSAVTFRPDDNPQFL